MSNSYLSERYILISGDNLNQKSLNNKEAVRTTDSTTKPHIDLMPYAPLLFAPIFFMIVSAVVALVVRSNFRKFPQNPKVIGNRFKQVPCKNCKFFNDNHYLNCAVNPSSVLTKEALNCSDYLPNSNIKESESTDDHFR